MSKPQSFIYVFLKNESGATITLIQLLSLVPLRQNIKNITDKLKMPKNKILTLFFKGTLLDENKTLTEQGVLNYGDVFVNIDDEATSRGQKSDKPALNSPMNPPKKPYSIQPQAMNQANQIMKPNWANFGLNEVVANKNTITPNVNTIIDESMSLGSPMHSPQKISIKKTTQNIINIKKNIKNFGVKKPTESEKATVKKITIIQAICRGKKIRKIYKLRVKKLRYRMCIIEELIQSEEKYKKSLSCIMSTIVSKCREKKILTKQEEDTVFATLENIADFSATFYSTLNSIYTNNFIRYKSKIAESVLKMMPYFKLYTPYFNKFDISRQYLEKLKKHNSKFAALLAENEHKPSLENMDLSSLLIKPIQRLPKYVLLFKDLKKNTEESHPDYKNIVQALEKFEDINSELNVQIKDYLRKIKIYDLQKLFGDPNKIQILEANREFLEEETINIILKDTPREGIIYFLTDLLLIAGQEKNHEWKLLKAAFLDANSYVREQQDTQYFSNVFTVYGKDAVTLCTETKEHQQKLMTVIAGLIKEIKSKNKHRGDNLKKLNKGKTLAVIKKLHENPIVIKAIGTIKRGLKNFNPYTVYVVQITKENWRQCLYFRYSELQKLDELVKKEFSGIVISHFPPKNWLNGQKPQVIESRKLLIEPFLESLLQNENVIDKPKKVLNFLGLPTNFYDIEAIENKPNLELEFAKDSILGRTLLKNISVLGLLSSLNSGFSRVQTINFLSSSVFDEKLSQDITIYLLNDQTVTLTITKKTQALDLCRLVAKELNLVSWADFKLFLIISPTEERRLEDDEYVYRAINSEFKDNNLLGNNEKFVEAATEDFVDSGDESRSKSPNKIPNTSSTSRLTNFFSGIKDTFNKGFKKIKTETKKLFSSECKLVFKKYIYLSKDIEAVDYTHDLIKLDLLTSQIFKEVYNLYYYLSLNDYCLISALRAYLLYGNINQVKANDFLHVMEEKSLKESIPDEVFYKKEKEFWVNTVGDNWKTFSEGIVQIAEYNKKFNTEANSAMLKSFQNPKVQQPSFSYNQKPTNLKVIAKFLTIDSMSKSPLYGAKCFWVNYEGPAKKKSKDFGWLAVSFNKIQLLNPKKVETNTVLYENIKSYRTFPDSFELTFIGDYETLSRQRRSLKFMSFHGDMESDKSEVNSLQASKEDLSSMSRTETVDIRFFSQNSFEIFQLIEIYRKLREEAERREEAETKN